MNEVVCKSPTVCGQSRRHPAASVLKVNNETVNLIPPKIEDIIFDRKQLEHVLSNRIISNLLQ